MALLRPSPRDLHLYIARHPKSLGNENDSLYKEQADHAIVISKEGYREALEAGAFLAHFVAMKRHPTLFHPDLVRVRNSPYYRTRWGAYLILCEMGKTINHRDGDLTYREGTMLFEQKAGRFDGHSPQEATLAFPKESADYAKHVKFSGKAYAQPPQGESRLNVQSRARDVLETIMRDYKKGYTHQVIMSHGVTNRSLIAALLNYPPEWTDAEKNPGNCWVRYIHGNHKTGFHDWGYVYGKGAPLRQPAATQTELKSESDIILLKPQRSREPLLKGENVRYLNPFDYK